MGEIVHFRPRDDSYSAYGDWSGTDGLVRVHPRVHKRHPELEEGDVLEAWRNAFADRVRDVESPKRIIRMALGVDGKGRTLEMLAVEADNGEILIFHAMTPPSKKALHEMGVR